MIFLFVANTLLPLYTASVYSANQYLTKLNMRATATAALLFFINIISAGVGPLIAGGLSDFFETYYGIESLRYAQATFSVAFASGCALLFLSTLSLEHDLNRVKNSDV